MRRKAIPEITSPVMKWIIALIILAGSIWLITKIIAMNRDMPSKRVDENITRSTVDSFNAAFNRHDVDAVMNWMTENCVFENTSPSPDGRRIEGAAAVREYWTKFFSSNPDAYFEAEEMIVAGDRCIVRWIYRKTKDGKPWHLRGVDVFRVKDGKVAEKLAYVKG